MTIRLHKSEGHVPAEEKIIQKADGLAERPIKEMDKRIFNDGKMGIRDDIMKIFNAR
jgi:hypothetical protein